ncbi:hypothetical protein A5893_17240 [Pedobacter psychrophilus]|uniref:Uncharacterized protein n=1 Tax=Pedobacter psychrophilus TaxID=1826909 RepID=A0A179DR22_9SPHI|nr:hypothetical protein [Pedobacter psychrophilus]OAQ43505.1 hypothetical protein A5893_17240 [Pedobacter psychrophilus]
MTKDLVLLNLNEKWNCNLPFGWIPITGEKGIPNTEIYQSNHFTEHITNLPDILKDIYDIIEVFEIQESGNMTFKKATECDFVYDGLEYIYTDKKFQFVIYCSHESSITVGGKELLEKIHEVWPDYVNRIWTFPFYT